MYQSYVAGVEVMRVVVMVVAAIMLLLLPRAAEAEFVLPEALRSLQVAPSLQGMTA